MDAGGQQQPRQQQQLHASADAAMSLSPRVAGSLGAAAAAVDLHCKLAGCCCSLHLKLATFCCLSCCCCCSILRPLELCRRQLSEVDCL